MKLTAHFDSKEFACPHCGRDDINKELVERLERLFAAIGADKIIISSGIRCSDYSVSVGGFANDMHVNKGAADLIVYKNGKPMSSFAVAAIAEDLGLFNGIGIIDDSYVHLDIRGIIPYSNSYWFGSEVDGTTYTTFKSYLPNWYKAGEVNEVHTIKIEVDGKSVYEGQLSS